jgi:hypothetical protein
MNITVRSSTLAIDAGETYNAVGENTGILKRRMNHVLTWRKSLP